MSLYDELKKIEPFSLAAHSDADGVYSATILKRLFKTIGKVELPGFNNYTTQVACDLGYPAMDGWKGIAIDHHPGHPEKREYNLYWDYMPTGLVLYKNLKEYLPKKDWWLVVGSAVGDGQAELVPPEIWDANPDLLNGRGSAYKYNFKISQSNYPLFVILSSGVNSMCRSGFPEQALQALEDFDNPIDLLESSTVKDASERMRYEEDAVFKNKIVTEQLGNWLSLVRIKTSKPQIKIGGIIGAKLSGVDDAKTYIVLNETSGEASLRGNFAKYCADKLAAMGYKAGGHAKFAGLSVEPDEVPALIKDIRKLRIG